MRLGNLRFKINSWIDIFNIPVKPENVEMNALKFPKSGKYFEVTCTVGKYRFEFKRVDIPPLLSFLPNVVNIFITLHTILLP